MFRSRFDSYPPYDSGYRNPILRLLLVALVVGSFAGLGIYAFNVGRDMARNLPLSSSKSQQIENDVKALRTELDELKIRVSPKLPEGDRTVEMQQLRADLERIDASLSRIGTAILADPVRALEVPLLQRDFEAMKQNQAQALSVVQQDISRLYALTGGGIAFLLSVSIPLVLSRQPKGAKSGESAGEKE